MATTTPTTTPVLVEADDLCCITCCGETDKFVKEYGGRCAVIPRNSTPKSGLKSAKKRNGVSVAKRIRTATMKATKNTSVLCVKKYSM